MYYVNIYINKKSEGIQAQLSDLTSTAQESYSGIRVLKSYAQEKISALFFDKESDHTEKVVYRFPLLKPSISRPSDS